MAALFLRFASGLARAGGLSRPQAPAREFLDAGDERLVACRAAGAGAGADRLDHGGILARPQPLRPVRDFAARLQEKGVRNLFRVPPEKWGVFAFFRKRFLTPFSLEGWASSTET